MTYHQRLGLLVQTKPLTIFDPDYTWKTKTLSDFKAEELLVPIFKSGMLVYGRHDTAYIREYCRCQIERQWDEVKRFEYPHNYYVDLSQKMWDMKHELLRSISSKV